MPHTDIAAIDFETATGQRSSACAIGIAVPQADGTIVGRSWLIRPPGNAYEPFNISIHGIKPQDTENAPSAVEVWAEVAEHIGDRALVAHNASFDMSVLRRSFEVHNVGLPREYQYLCTYRLAQLVWPDRWSYRLPDIVSDLGLPTSSLGCPRRTRDRKRPGLRRRGREAQRCRCCEGTRNRSPVPRSPTVGPVQRRWIATKSLRCLGQSQRHRD